MDMTTTRDLTDLHRLDAAFEATLGSLVLAACAIGWLGGSDFSASGELIAGFGVALLAGSACTLIYVAPRAAMPVLLVLGAGNAAMAACAAAWLVAGGSGFSARGAVALTTFITWKAAIGCGQLRPSRGIAR